IGRWAMWSASSKEKEGEILSNSSGREQILNFFHRLDVVPFTLLVTSDHGYNIFEENGILSVGHGGGEHALLGLDRVALFAVLKKRSGVWL
ncbi:MAG: hypothetical protein DRN95_07400, partial [Candidatus Hydrothermarchaeota archaeon]